MTNQIKRNSAVGECDLYGGHLLQVFLFICNITPYELHDKHLRVNTCFQIDNLVENFCLLAHAQTMVLKIFAIDCSLYQ